MGKYLAVRDYDVKLLSFPNNAADSCVVTDPDGSGFLTIIINANLSRERQIKAYWHEVEHIEKEHLYSNDAVDTIEERMPA